MTEYINGVPQDGGISTTEEFYTYDTFTNNVTVAWTDLDNCTGTIPASASRVETAISPFSPIGGEGDVRVLYNGVQKATGPMNIGASVATFCRYEGPGLGVSATLKWQAKLDAGDTYVRHSSAGWYQ